MSIRSFVALPVPETLAVALEDDAARLASQDKGGRVRWVEHGNYHVTLAFLGEIEEDRLEELAAELEVELSLFGPVTLEIESVTLFPLGNRPRLIAAMIKSNDRLTLLHKAVARAARKSAIYIERRRFTPHITLGRLRAGGRREMRLPVSASRLSAPVAQVSVFESTLTPQGAIYEPLYEFSLDQAPDFDVASG